MLTPTGAIILTLSLIPLIPLLIEMVHFLIYGGLGWQMIWGNEVVAWGAILSPTAILATWVSFKSNRKFLAFVCSVIFVSVAALPLFSGISASSKGDSQQLQLLSFWTVQWQSW